MRAQYTLLVTLAVTAASAQGGVSESAVQYLYAHQQPDGSISASGEDAIVATAETVLSLRDMGFSGGTELSNAEFFLAIQAPGVETERERLRSLALALSAWVIADPVAETHAGGFVEPDALHLALAIDALAPRAPLPSTEEAVRGHRLAAMALSDGCYGFADNGPSAELTARALIALRRAGFTPTLLAAATKSAACLLTLQDSDGSFGSASATGLAILALAHRAEAAAAIVSAKQWLTSAQRTDGSWEDSVRATALVLRGLQADAPDWRVLGDAVGRPAVTLRDPRPLQGEPTVALLTVENSASKEAPGNRVHVVAVRAGLSMVVGQVDVPPLLPGERVDLTVPVDTSGLAGRWTVEARVDPTDAVHELDEFNNRGSTSIEVRLEQDLYMASTGIRFTELSATKQRIEAHVQNVGIAISTSVAVRFYKGPPAQGVFIGETSIPGLAQNSSASAMVEWTSTSANGATAIYVVADASNVVVEANEQNNSAFRYFFPGTTGAVDLSVVAADVIVSPAVPRPGDRLMVSATIRNLSSRDANRVLVELSEFGANTVLGAREIPVIEALGSKVVMFESYASTSASLRIVVDPYQALNDTKRTNNMVSAQVSVGRSPAELSISTTANPRVPTATTPAKVFATVRNTGDRPVETTVTLRDREGSLWAKVPVTLSAASAGSATNVNVDLGDYRTIAGDVWLEACVDPDGAIREENERDNCDHVTLGSGVADLYAAPHDITVSPLGPSVGEKVHVSAVVRNRRPTPASAVVEWWSGRPSVDGALLGETPIQVPASGAATVAFDYIRPPGPAEIIVRIARVQPNEVSDPDNVTGRHLFLKELLDLGHGLSTTVPDIRVGRVSGNPYPDIVAWVSEYLGNSQRRDSVVFLAADAAGKHSESWRAAVDGYDGDIVLADVDGDSASEVIIQASGVNTWTLESRAADGAQNWRVQEADACSGGTTYGGRSTGIGDLNGDGVQDLVALGMNLRVYSGDDGRKLFEIPVWWRCENAQGDVYVLDVDGDGKNEIVFHYAGHLWLAGPEGIRWTTSGLVNSARFAIADLDGDGSPEAFLPIHRYPPRAIDLRTGEVIATGSPYESWAEQPAIGSIRQDGMPYAVISSNSGQTQASIAAFGPDLQATWATSTYAPDITHLNYASTLVDLLGTGRPQVLATSHSSVFELFDSRDGTAIEDAPHWAVDYGIYRYMTYRPPLVANVDGKSGAELVIGAWDTSDFPRWASDGRPQYNPHDLLIFGSDAWEDAPPTWPTRTLVRNYISDELAVNSGYRWWDDHNTWNQQFLDQPVELLPDLVAQSITVPLQLTSGTSTSVAVTIRNVGGLPVTAATVELYLGDPEVDGRMVASTVTSSPLEMRGTTATVNFDWEPYPDGEQTLYAVVNRERGVRESGYENNSASARVFIQPGEGLCDLRATQVTASPASPIAGDLVTYEVMVENAGGKPCEATGATLWNGAVQVGEVLGGATVASLDPGASTLVIVQAVASPGTHVLRWEVDPNWLARDGDRANNIAVHELVVPASELPDLAAVALGISPQAPFAGESLTVSARVKNFGSSAEASTYAVAIDGAIVATAELPPLRSGESVDLTIDVRAPQAAAALELRVDPSNAAAEFDETNNTLQRTISPASAQVLVALAATPTSVGPEQAVQLSAALQNVAAAARELTVDGHLEDASGTTVATLSSRRVVIAPSGSASIQATWQTGRSRPGAYTYVAELREAGRRVADARTGITVVASESVASTFISTDRALYAPNDTVLLTQSVQNGSLNVDLIGAVLQLVVLAPDGRELFATRRNLPALPPGGAHFGTDLFALSAQQLPGTYTVRSQLLSGAGEVLATSLREWKVEARASAVVSGLLELASPFTAGSIVTAAMVVSNAGALNLVDEPLEVLLLNPERQVIEASASGTVTVGANASVTVVFALATLPGSLGEKVLVARLGETTLHRLLVVAVENADSEPPVIRLSGVSEGLLTREDVVPTIAIEDQSPYTATVLLDGLSYVLDQPIVSEREHVLTVTAVDAYGHAANAAVRFTIDKTAPEISMEGPADASLVAAPALLSFSASDPHGVTTTASLDGLAIESGYQVDSDGTYVWSVRAEDGAGNEAVLTRTFSVDATAPVVVISGLPQPTLTNGPVALLVTADEPNLKSLDVTVNGVPYLIGDTLWMDGDYTLEVRAEDAVGHITEQAASFTIDSTPPQLALDGPAHGALVAAPVNLAFSATDPHSAHVTASLDEVSIGNGHSVQSDGTYAWHIRAEDDAGNVAEERRTFTVDASAPVITVSGLPPAGLAAGPLTLFVSADDAHLSKFEVTVNGAPFLSGDILWTDGAYTLVARAEDSVGHVSERTEAIAIDTAPPELALLGFQDGEVTRGPVTAGYHVMDAHLAEVIAELDGQPWASPTTIDAEGLHRAKVTATDLVGLATTREATFDIDRTAPVVRLTGVEPGAYSADPVTVTVLAEDRNLRVTHATLDGVEFTGSVAVASEGAHHAAAEATDAAGNTTTADLRFVVDLTNPVVAVSGVTEGAIGEAFVLSWSALDTNLRSVTAELDGASVQSGVQVDGAGTHSLRVVAVDWAGRSTTRQVSFRVIRVRPSFHFAVCALGSLTVENNVGVDGVGEVIGSMAANGDISFLNRAHVDGDLVAGGNVSLAGNTKVLGTAYHGGSFALLNSASCGAHVSVTPAPVPCECGYELDGAFALVQHANDNWQLEMDPQLSASLAEGVLTLVGVQATLPAGRYFLRGLALRGPSTLTASGDVELFVAGNVEVENTARLGTAVSQPGRMLVVASADATSGGFVRIDNNSDAALHLYAPKAQLASESSARIHGALVGREVRLSNRLSLTFAPGPQAVPPFFTCP